MTPTGAENNQFIATMTSPSVVTTWSLTGVSVACASLAPIIAVFAGLLGIAYTAYQFRREVRRNRQKSNTTNDRCDSCPARKDNSN